jgi:hypothetical protein
MSCGKVHTRRQVAAKRHVVAAAKHSAPVARRAATPTKKGVAARAVPVSKKVSVPARRSKATTRIVVKVTKRNQVKFTRAGFLTWLAKQKHPAAHKVACQVKMRHAVVSKKVVKQQKLARPFKAPVDKKAVKVPVARKGVKAVKSRKALCLR